MENEIKNLINRLEKQISITPTGELRNLLADANIVIQTFNTNKFQFTCDAHELLKISNRLKQY